MALASELARSVREAVTCSKTLRKTEIAQIEELLPGVHVLAVVVRVGHLAVQTSLGLWQMNEGTARTSINSWPMNGLSSMAISSNTTITRPAEKLSIYPDLQNLLHGTKCSNVACIPLRADAAEDGAPFGTLIAGFHSDAALDASTRGAQDLAHFLSSENHRELIAHTELVLRTLLSPPSASSSEAGTDVAQDMAVVLGVSDSDGGEDSGWSSDEDDLPLSSVPPPSHTLWMTFHNAILERSYVAWSARHMRAMDPAATLFSCVYLLALGWYPTFNLVATHPVMWGLGWVGLSPMLLCLLCPTYEWFLAQRERCIAAFHGVGLVWQTAVLNAAEPLEVVLLGQWSPVWRDPVVGALSWQVTNILMFQMRWKWMVAVACAVFMINTLPLLGPMCGVWGLDWAPHAPVSGFWGGEGDPHLGGATTADSLE